MAKTIAKQKQTTSPKSDRKLNRRPDSRNGDEPRSARYEYRVWGEHPKARKILSKLADSSSRETVKDCYLLVDDPTWNAKVRDNEMKVKQLVNEDRGFERWTRERPKTRDAAPTPFDTIFTELQLDRAARGGSFDLREAISRLDPSLGVTAVFVTKDRRRYQIGNMRAEVTDITIRDGGDKLQTLSIEGDKLKDLVALRKTLGIKREPNIAVHQAILTSNQRQSK